MDTLSYVAFLRGINVGGNKKVDMGELKKAFESLGCHHVRTILNTGNVVFMSHEHDSALLTKDIEKELEKKFGFFIPTIVRLHLEICLLVKEQPFRSTTVTPQTRLYVTFFSESSKLPSLYISSEKDFQILRVSRGVALSVLTVSKNRGTTDVMKILEREFGLPLFGQAGEAGLKITTRNWNTIVKIAEIHV
ncbi:DUF1697 domain-containing protein [Candidatus Gottesmanbacteria bacterium]|nr:DUF1697 domain-containing protein [Candidatus Gottesmanbacteria bacterium]